jgi:hypothetical protein
MNARAAEIWHQLWESPSSGEWWATDKPNQFIIEQGGIAYRVTVDEVTDLPAMTPSEWQDSNAPHPFGWQATHA